MGWESNPSCQPENSNLGNTKCQTSIPKEQSPNNHYYYILFSRVCNKFVINKIFYKSKVPYHRLLDPLIYNLIMHFVRG